MHANLSNLINIALLRS